TPSSGMSSRFARKCSVIDVHAPRAADRKSYGVGPRSVPPALAGSSAMSLCAPAAMSVRNDLWDRTMTGPMEPPLHQSQLRRVLRFEKFADLVCRLLFEQHARRLVVPINGEISCVHMLRRAPAEKR